MPSDGTASLILCNAKVITVDEQRPGADFVAIKGNTILAVGNKDDLGIFRGPATRVFDCAGGSVVPGFNDAHCHPFALAISLLSVDCSPRNARRIADIQAAIRRRTQELPHGKWIRGTNYDGLSIQEGRAPNRWELDDAAPDHPVLLVDNTGQHYVLNSFALRLAKIDRYTTDVQGGQVQLDAATGEPTGMISGNADVIRKVVPPVDMQQLEAGMRLASRQYLSQGITSVQDTSWTNGRRHWQSWQRMSDNRAMACRISVLLGTEDLAECQAAGLTMGHGNAWLRVAGVKLALDESTGCSHPDQDAINQAARQTRQAGYKLAFHASDAHMLASSLAAIRFACLHVKSSPHDFRLEHCSVCPPELLPRLAASRVTVVTQPAFLYSFGHQYLSLPSDQAGWLWPAGSFQRDGVRVAFSSDSPLVTSDPLVGLYAAMTRKTRSGDVLALHEKVALEPALESYTLSGAHASSEGTIKGSISPGKMADVAVLDADLAQLAPENLRDVHVVLTIIDGQEVWRR
jgi:predicted amidohydrolase YtcJ